MKYKTRIIYYRVRCFYITKEPEHFHYFNIGIFDSKQKAEEAIDQIKDKPGFIEHNGKIKIRKIIKLFRPKVLNEVFWADGFVTYRY